MSAAKRDNFFQRPTRLEVVGKPSSLTKISLAWRHAPNAVGALMTPACHFLKLADS